MPERCDAARGRRSLRPRVVTCARALPAPYRPRAARRARMLVATVPADPRLDRSDALGRPSDRHIRRAPRECACPTPRQADGRSCAPEPSTHPVTSGVACVPGRSLTAVWPVRGDPLHALGASSTHHPPAAMRRGPEVAAAAAATARFRRTAPTSRTRDDAGTRARADAAPLAPTIARPCGRRRLPSPGARVSRRRRGARVHRTIRAACRRRGAPLAAARSATRPGPPGTA